MLRAAMLMVLAGMFALSIDDASAQTKSAPDKLQLAQAQSTQSTRQARRVRPQIRVSPRYPYRTFHSPYPIPYTYEYPGPNGVRYCVNRYVTENRPSGPVLVPRTRCWWEARR